MLTTYLEFCGITISITTNWDVYHDFINLYLKNFLSSPVKEPVLRIQSMFPPFPGNAVVSPPFSPDNMRRAGLNMHFNERQVHYQLGNWNIFVQFDENDSILIYCEDNIRLQKRGGNREFLKKAVRKVIPQPQSKVYGAFQTHMRLTFHFPLFWLLEVRRGLHLLHGAAVQLNGSGVIFAGLATVGKTTLATFLYFNYPNTIILTDNFLLYGHERIYAFPEASRLSKQGIDIASAQPLLDDSFLLGHRDHWIPPKPDPGGYVPKKAFLVCLGNNLGVEPVSSEFFIETALELNDIVKEFHNYSYTGVFPFATRRSFNTYASRVQTLMSCMRNVDCAILTIPHVSSLADIRRDILNILNKG